MPSAIELEDEDDKEAIKQKLKLAKKRDDNARKEAGGGAIEIDLCDSD